MNEAEVSHPSLADLTAFDAGSLSPAERETVERHLAVCPECGRRIDNLPEDPFVALVRASASSAPSAGLAGPVPPAPDAPAALADHPRYRLVERIGSGGMGAVYKAIHRLMDRVVALKVPHPHFLDRPGFAERFGREARAAARLTHPNIVLAHDAEQAGDLPFLVMEYVPGTSLDRLVAQRGPLPVAEACEYARQAALGLQHAHDNGMVHRDVKPANLMRTPDGLIKVLDFGLAHLARMAEEDVSSDGAEGAVLGTPDYTAPEQARAPHSVDARADVYGLGCTLFFLLTGHPPYPGGTVLKKLLAHQDHPTPALQAARSDVPPALAALVERMLAKDPTKRPSSAAAVARLLTPFVAPADTPPLPIEPSSVAPSRTRWQTWTILCAGVFFVLGGTGILVRHLRAPSGAAIPVVAAPGDESTVERPVENLELATPEQLAARKRERREQVLTWLRTNTVAKLRDSISHETARRIDGDFDKLDGIQLLLGRRLTLSGQAALLTANPVCFFVAPLTAEQARALDLAENGTQTLIYRAPLHARRATPRVRLHQLRIDCTDEPAYGRKITGSVAYEVRGPAVSPPFAVRLMFYSGKGRRCSGMVWFKNRDLSGNDTLAFACPLPGGPENRPAGPFVLFADVVSRGPDGDLLAESDSVAILTEAAPPAKSLSP